MVMRCGCLFCLRPRRESCLNPIIAALRTESIGFPGFGVKTRPVILPASYLTSTFTTFEISLMFRAASKPLTANQYVPGSRPFAS
jgi:hypothetical protein